jgi:hypothetical protein
MSSPSSLLLLLLLLLLLELLMVEDAGIDWQRRVLRGIEKI